LADQISKKQLGGWHVAVLGKSDELFGDLLDFLVGDAIEQRFAQVGDLSSKRIARSAMVARAELAIFIALLGVGMVDGGFDDGGHVESPKIVPGISCAQVCCETATPRTSAQFALAYAIVTRRDRRLRCRLQERFSFFLTGNDESAV